VIGLVPALLPPPPSTVNGPFFPLDVVLHGSLSILALRFATGGAAVLVPPPALAAGGLGSNGLSLVVLDELADVVERGDDLDEVVDRGDGPLTGGDGDALDNGDMVDEGNMLGCEDVSNAEAWCEMTRRSKCGAEGRRSKEGCHTLKVDRSVQSKER